MQASVEKDVNAENVAMELNGLRLSHHASFADCINTVTPFILDQIKNMPFGNANEFVANMQKVINRWEPLIKYIIKGQSDEAQLIRDVEKYCLNEASFQQAFHLFIQVLIELSKVNFRSSSKKKS